MLGGGSVQAPPDGRGRLLPSRSLCGLSQSEAAAGGLRIGSVPLPRVASELQAAVRV